MSELFERYLAKIAAAAFVDEYETCIDKLASGGLIYTPPKNEQERVLRKLKMDYLNRTSKDRVKYYEGLRQNNLFKTAAPMQKLPASITRAIATGAIGAGIGAALVDKDRSAGMSLGGMAGFGAGLAAPSMIGKVYGRSHARALKPLNEKLRKSLDKIEKQIGADEKKHKELSSKFMNGLGYTRELKIKRHGLLPGTESASRARDKGWDTLYRRGERIRDKKKGSIELERFRYDAAKKKAINKLRDKYNRIIPAATIATGLAGATGASAGLRKLTHMEPADKKKHASVQPSAKPLSPMAKQAAAWTKEEKDRFGRGVKATGAVAGGALLGTALGYGARTAMRRNPAIGMAAGGAAGGGVGALAAYMAEKQRRKLRADIKQYIDEGEETSAK